jgi:hypothetical protein
MRSDSFPVSCASRGRRGQRAWLNSTYAAFPVWGSSVPALESAPEGCVESAARSTLPQLHRFRKPWLGLKLILSEVWANIPFELPKPSSSPSIINEQYGMEAGNPPPSADGWGRGEAEPGEAPLVGPQKKQDWHAGTAMCDGCGGGIRAARQDWDTARTLWGDQTVYPFLRRITSASML